MCDYFAVQDKQSKKCESLEALERATQSGDADRRDAGMETLLMLAIGVCTHAIVVHMQWECCLRVGRVRLALNRSK